MIDYNAKEITCVKKGDLFYLTFNALDMYSEKLKHCITLRHGGSSKGVYSSLNFRLSGNDDTQNVYENLESICNCLDINSLDVYKGYQDHTDNVIILDNKNKKEFAFKSRSIEKVDGYVVKEPNIATLVTTADCNPIIIYDPVNNVYANVHSGWKGTVKRIYIKAIEKMKQNFNTKEENLIVCVGPAVLKCCFTSKDSEFKEIFANVWPDTESYIFLDKQDKERFHIDLSYVIKKDLIKIGVKENNIHFANICTCCNHDNFYSYRYKTQNNEEDYGCMATIVELK